MIVNTSFHLTKNTNNYQQSNMNAAFFMHVTSYVFVFAGRFLAMFIGLLLVATSLVAQVAVVFLVRHVVYEALVLCWQDRRRMACAALGVYAVLAVCLLGITKLGLCLLWLT